MGKLNDNESRRDYWKSANIVLKGFIFPTAARQEDA